MPSRNNIITSATLLHLTAPMGRTTTAIERVTETEMVIGEIGIEITQVTATGVGGEEEEEVV